MHYLYRKSRFFSEMEKKYYIRIQELTFLSMIICISPVTFFFDTAIEKVMKNFLPSWTKPRAKTMNGFPLTWKSGSLLMKENPHISEISL